MKNIIYKLFLLFAFLGVTYSVSAQSAYNGCPDFMDISASYVETYVGETDNPFEKDSFASERHNLIVEQGVDQNTGGQLSFIPNGEVKSVRIGNDDIGGESEALVYHFTVDPENTLLFVNFAVVLEDPGHDFEFQPRFVVRVTDKEGRLVSECSEYDVSAAAGIEGFQDYSGRYTMVRWRDWSKFGLDLSPYAGEEVQVQFITYDCFLYGHFGYAYYTLNCEEATIEGLSCGENAGKNIKAPIGFNYRWYRVRDNKTVCTTQNLQGVEKNDTALYRCKVMFAQDSACYFELDASLLPRFPKAQFSPKWVPRYCNENYMKFQNTSHVTTARGATGEKCETHRWYLKEDGDWKLVHEGDTLEYRFPNGGGSFEMMLQAGISNDECLDDTIVVVNVPRLGAVTDTICDTICEGKSVKIEGRRYMQEGIYRVYRGTSFGGCDSTVYLDLKVIPKERDSISAYLCGNESYILNGQEFTRSGKYRTVNKADSASSCECDTVVTLFLTVAKLDIPEIIELCSGDDLVIEYGVGDIMFESYEIQFSDPAKAIGLKDISKRPLSEGNVIELKADEISDKTGEINPLIPGEYVMNVVFYYIDERGVEQACNNVIKLNILYSAKTIEQKFGNLMTLLDSENNGGFDFDYIQWYKNGVPMEGENDTYIYLLEEGAVNGDDVYTVGLIRKGEDVEIMSCGLRFDTGVEVENVESLGVDVASNRVDVGERAIVLFEEGGDECVVRWWSVAGVLMGEEVMIGDGYLSSTPQIQGVYLLELVLGNERVIRKVVIE